MGRAMDFGDSDRERALRSRLRHLIAAQVPTGFLGAFTNDARDFETAQRFCAHLADHDLLTMAWPSRFGGGDASVWEQTVVREEMWAHHEPRGAQYMGVNWVGPAIMRSGTPAQIDEHLRRISAGSVIWCQGFSEPDAGSDLASLSTRAVRDGDGWVINGQKIWTSYATMADWCFLLARTDIDVAKHHGITVFLVPMTTPGIEVRPIETMLGPHHLNEVFFDDVWVDDASVLGEVNGGWSIVREALAFERVGIARYARCDRLLNLAPLALGDRWNQLPVGLKHRWVRALVHTRQVRLSAYRVIQMQDRGEVDPGQAAAYRIAATQLDQESAEVLMDIIEERAVGASVAEDLFARAVEDHWRYAQAATVASGSIEMQRILLSRSLLGVR